MPNYPVLDGLYQVRETIGSGGFAKVKLGVHIVTGEKVAIKIMDKNFLADEIPRIYIEIEALKTVMHQNICRLYQVIETKDKVFMILEYCSEGELYEHIVSNDRLPEDEARMFFRQIVGALAHLHEKGYVHRDLKPENLLLDEEHNLKLIDFGLCAQPKDGMQSQLDTCCGSPAYAAPELIEGKHYVGSEADLWSLGVLLYALLCGCLPFEDENTTYLYKKIQAGKYEIPDWMSEKSADVIRKLLQVDPKRRATIDDLLEDPWVTEDFSNPLSWRSQLRHDVVDVDCLTLMSTFHEKTKDEMQQLILGWNYDYLTATYLLLLNKKTKGKPLRLGSHHLNAMQQNPLNVMIPDNGLSNNCYDPPYENLGITKMDTVENLSTDKENQQSNGVCSMSPAVYEPVGDNFTAAESRLRQQAIDKTQENECVTIVSLVERDCQKTRACPATHDDLDLEWPFGLERPRDTGQDRQSDAESGCRENYITAALETDDFHLNKAGTANTVSENLNRCVPDLATGEMFNLCKRCKDSDAQTMWQRMVERQEVSADLCAGRTQTDKLDVTESADEINFTPFVQNSPSGWMRKKRRTGSEFRVKVHRSRCFQKCHKGRILQGSSSARQRDYRCKARSCNGSHLANAEHKVVHKPACRKFAGDKEMPLRPLWPSFDWKEDLHLTEVEDYNCSGLEAIGCFSLCCGEKPVRHANGTPLPTLWSSNKIFNGWQTEALQRFSRAHVPGHVTNFCAVKGEKGKFLMPHIPKISHTHKSSTFGVPQPRMLHLATSQKNLQGTPAMSALLHSVKNASPRRHVLLKDHLNLAISPSRSFDSQLNNLELGANWLTAVKDTVCGSVDAELNRLHLSRETPHALPHKKLVVGNTERSMDRLLCVITPKKKALQTEPRNIRDAHNIYITNYECPSSVLHRLKAVLEEKSVPYQEEGYMLRSVLTDKDNKVQLAFEFEVVRLCKPSAIGVQRKKIKGDSWYYKQLCESILTAARL